MSARELRLLRPAWMLEATGRRRRGLRLPVPPIRRGRPRSEGPAARIEALTKLKALFDSGVLTYQQFADERDRLLGD